MTEEKIKPIAEEEFLQERILEGLSRNTILEISGFSKNKYKNLLKKMGKKLKADREASLKREESSKSSCIVFKKEGDYNSELLEHEELLIYKKLQQQDMGEDKEKEKKSKFREFFINQTVQTLTVSEEEASLRADAFLSTDILEKYNDASDIKFQIAMEVAMKIPQLKK